MAVQLVDESHWDDLVIIIAVVCQYDLCYITWSASYTLSLFCSSSHDFINANPYLGTHTALPYLSQPFFLIMLLELLGQFKAEGNK